MGLVVYCTLANGELREYNATIMAYLPDKSVTVSENLTSIDHLQIENEYVVTFDKTLLKLFTFVDHLSFVMETNFQNGH
jgi:hypothetical protein